MIVSSPWKRLLGGVLVLGCLFGCAAGRSPAANDIQIEGAGERDRAAAELFCRQTGTRWYGVYEDAIKVGWGKEVRKIAAPLTSSNRTFHILRQQEVQLLINGYVHEVVYQLDLWFETRPPFALERYEYEERINDFVRFKQMVRKGRSYQRIDVRDGLKNALPDLDMTYALADELALELWVRESPKVGDFIQVDCLDPDDLRQEGGFAKVIRVESVMENGRSLKTYRIDHPQKGQGEYQSVYRSDLTLASQRFESEFELRNETEAMARAPIPREDLYIRYMLPIEGTLGRSDAVKRVAFSIDAATGVLLSDATGQSIEMDSENGGYRIILDTAESLRESASTYEKNIALEVDSALKAGDAAIVKDAQKALEGIDDPREKVEKLLAFVDETVEDSNEVISPNLKYVLEKRKGDCSEHAILFEALARYFEIPCRRVSGLVYMGDWAQSFGLHAWNEIVLKDYWHPVDPIEQAYDLPPFYIRFPLNRAARDKLARRVPKMKLRVLEVENHATGK